jgi:hypothetical protein
MFRLTKDEYTEVVTNCDHLQNLKYRPSMPYAFTEQGVAMLATVLNSQKRQKIGFRPDKVTDCYDSNCWERLVLWSDGTREPVAGWTVS